MSKALDKLQAMWHDMFYGRMFISPEWWARWDATFMKIFSEVETMVASEKGHDFDPRTTPPLGVKIKELSKILKSIDVCNDASCVREDGRLELSSTAQAFMNDCVGNELHKIMFLMDDPGAEVGSVERVKNVVADLKEVIAEFRELTLGKGA